MGHRTEQKNLQKTERCYFDADISCHVPAKVAESFKKLLQNFPSVGSQIDGTELLNGLWYVACWEESSTYR